MTTNEEREALIDSVRDYPTITRLSHRTQIEKIEQLRDALLAAAPDHQAEAPSDEALWDFANDLLDAWNIEDTNPPSLIEDFRDRFVARFAALAARPVVDDAAIERALNAWLGLEGEQVDQPEARLWRRRNARTMRAALEAAALGGDQ